MRSILLSITAGPALLLCIGLTAASAMPGRLDGASPSAEITLVAGGCGPGFHRGFYGGCRPSYYRGGYGYRRFGNRGYGFRNGYYRNF